MITIGTENNILSGIFLVTGYFISCVLIVREFQKERKISHIEVAFLLILPIFYTFFSHLLYCIVEIDAILYEKSWIYFLHFWDKGQQIYGGLLGVVLASLLFFKKNTAKILDKVSIASASFVIFFRLSEIAMGQGYGEYWEEASTWFLRFPFMLYDQENELWAWAILMLSVLVAFLSILQLYRVQSKFLGDKFFLFLANYSCFQILIESLRRDEYLRWGFVRVEQLESAIVILAILLIYTLKYKKKKAIILIKSIFSFIFFIISIILLEFATEDRVAFLRFLDPIGIYIVMFLLCVLQLFYICQLRKTLSLNLRSL